MHQPVMGTETIQISYYYCHVYHPICIENECTLCTIFCR